MLRGTSALAGMSGIRTELPACRVFAEALPAISHAGMTYRFNFLRLSVVPQVPIRRSTLTRMPPLR